MQMNGSRALNDEIVSLEQLVDSIPENREIVLYGAGVIAKMLEWCLKRMHRTVKMFLVTRIGGADLREIDSVPVFSVGEVQWNFENTTFIIATKKRVSQFDMLGVLIEKNAADIIMFSTELENSIRKNYLSGQLMEGRRQYKLLYESDNHFVFGRQDSEKYCWRIHKVNSIPLRNFQDLWDHDLLELFEKQYGKYQPIEDFEFKQTPVIKSEYIYAAKSDMDRKIANVAEESIIQYVQAGAALSQHKICDLADNVGENISIKNRNYSECTVLYWIWKHIKDAQYIGFCQYRRILKLPFDDLAYLDGTGIDIIVTTPTICDCGIKNYFVRRYISKHDWDYMMEGIKAFDEEYYQTALLYENSYFFSPCNLLIMKREILDEYCNFAFQVAEYIEEKFQSIGLQRQDRYMGYLFENLLAIFVMHHKGTYSVAYADMIYLQ